MTKQEKVLRDLLEKIAKEQKLKDPQIQIKPITSEGANYTSAIFKITITSTNREPLKLFAKVATLAEAFRPQFNADHLFEVERVVYNDVVKAYDKLQEQNGIPLEERFRFPVMYGYNPTKMEETLVLEDLTEQGFILFDRIKPINWEYAAKSVEQLAKLHALSFAYKSVYPEEYQRVFEKLALIEPSTASSGVMWKKIEQTVMNTLPEEYKERFVKYIENKKEKYTEVFQKYYGPGHRDVIVHGDYRNSNIMFKRENGKVKSVTPVDYQTMRISNPVTDLLYFIYTGTDGDFRRLHTKQLLAHYYNTLSSFLLRLNVNPDESYPRDDFYNEYNDFLPFGLNMAIYLLPMALVDAQNAPNTSAEGSMEEFAFKSDDSFDKRFNDIFLEFCQLGVV